MVQPSSSTLPAGPTQSSLEKPISKPTSPNGQGAPPATLAPAQQQSVNGQTPPGHDNPHLTQSLQRLPQLAAPSGPPASQARTSSQQEVSRPAQRDPAPNHSEPGQADIRPAQPSQSPARPGPPTAPREQGHTSHVSQNGHSQRAQLTTCWSGPVPPQPIDISQFCQSQTHQPHAQLTQSNALNNNVHETGRPGIPSVIQGQEKVRQRLYDLLGELDPYRATPKEFINLLVSAAMRDEETAQSIHRMNADRLHNPRLWTPVIPPHLRSQPGQPGQPGQIQPQQEHETMLQEPSRRNSQQPPVPAPPGIAPLIQQSRVQRHQHPHYHYHGGGGTVFQPPQVQQRIPVAVDGHQYGPRGQHMLPSQPPAVPPTVLTTAPTPHSATANGQIPPPPNNITLKREPVDESSSQDGLHSVPPASKAPPAPEEPPECEETAQNFTWVIDRAETHLGWTGQHDKLSEIQKTSMGHNAAIKIQRLLKKMNSHMDKWMTFANRLHILCVMKEVIMCTLETGGIIGKECKECAREYDINFVEAVRKLTSPQVAKIRALENGKWIQELQDLVTEADGQELFPWLKQALIHLDSP
ncbi:hypothetical protein F5Y15DRAFT_12176 [Xylariaceae sp. FL0016]|nr:hypothetical protein F5Y15DRAFT_12176 [Xylariaceae sp. FL0016]